jgi:hypothetical protein
MRAQSIPWLYFNNVTIKDGSTRKLFYKYLINNFRSNRILNIDICLSKKQLIDKLNNEELMNTFQFNYG